MATKSKKACTISYHRVNWPIEIDKALTLQKVLTRVLGYLPSFADTTVNLGDGKAEIRHRLVQRSGLMLHVAAWTEGESVSTVPHTIKGPDGDLKAKKPEKDWDFLDSDGMIYVRGDHYLVLPNGLSASYLLQYIHNLIVHAREKGANLPDKIDKFDLIAIVNPKMAEKLTKEGVKKIIFDMGQFWETELTKADRKSSNLLVNLTRTIRTDFLTDDRRREQVKNFHNLNARLTLSLDSRLPGIKPKYLGKMTNNYIKHLKQDGGEDDQTGTVLVTARNTQIKGGDIVLKKHVKILKNAKSIVHNQAWEEMREYLRELSKDGMLEK